MNKNVKRILSVILCAMMLLTLMPMTIYAEDKKPEITFECNTDKIEVGVEFEILVTLKNVTDLKTASLLGQWNHSELELVSVYNPYPLEVYVPSQETFTDSFFYILEFDEPFSGDQCVMKMVFIAKKECISSVELWVNMWNDEFAHPGFYNSAFPDKLTIELPVKAKSTTFEIELSEEKIEIGEIVEITFSLENCVNLQYAEIHIYYDCEYFAYYDERVDESFLTYCNLSGPGHFVVEKAHIFDENLFGELELCTVSLRALKAGKSNISVVVEEWAGNNKPDDKKYSVNISDELYVNELQYDVNRDGKVTALDARITLRTAARIEKLYGKSHEAADADSDQRITASDARKILRRAAKLE